MIILISYFLIGWILFGLCLMYDEDLFKEKLYDSILLIICWPAAIATILVLAFVMTGAYFFIKARDKK